MNKYYKNAKGEIYSFSPIQQVPAGFTQLTQAEEEAHLNPPTPPEQLAANLRAERDAALNATTWLLERHTEEQALNLPTSLTNTAIKALLTYRQQLRDLPTCKGFPNCPLPPPPEI